MTRHIPVEEENRIVEEVARMNQHSRIFNENTRAIHAAIDECPDLRQYAGKTLYVIAANGRVYCLVGPGEIDYRDVIEENAKRVLSDGYFDNPRVVTIYITRDKGVKK